MRIKNDQENNKDTINKMVDLYKILTDPPNDKRFNNKYADYLIEFMEIYNIIYDDNKDYSDKNIQNAINSLYDKVFKHRG